MASKQGAQKKPTSSKQASGRRGEKEPSAGGRGATKHRSSRESEAPPFPDDFGFLWSINPVETAFPDAIPRYGLAKAAKNENAAYWFPPNRKGDLKFSGKETIYQWRTRGKAEVFCGHRDTLEPYSVASVFIQALQDNFLAVEVDCVKHDVKKRDMGWSQIKFNHLNGNRAGLSEVVFRGDRFTLAVPADGSSWMPQVVPAVYNRAIKGPKRFNGPLYSYHGLCGKLALIVSMAAFSAPEDSAEDVVARCFRDQHWLPHEFKHGSRQYKNEHLRAFEDGHYGAILEIGDASEPQAPVIPTRAPIASLSPTTTRYADISYAQSPTLQSNSTSMSQSGNRYIPSMSPTTSNYTLVSQPSITQHGMAPGGYSYSTPRAGTTHYPEDDYMEENEDAEYDQQMDYPMKTSRSGREGRR
ncbi:MAG: hypothetical protein M1818_001908 [Claussenomyces sp. TS43310]|nr:MAG: hypothetical protein M1818_001908 [Claussenomyces sp. TS43310]